MFVTCYHCKSPIYNINVVMNPAETREVTILALGNINLEQFWGADIKCECGHKNTGRIFESSKGICIGQKEYELKQ